MNNENQNLNDLYGNGGQPQAPSMQPTAEVNTSQNINDLYGNPTTPQVQPEQPQIVNQMPVNQEPVVAQPEVTNPTPPAPATTESAPSEPQPEEPNNQNNDSLISAFIGPNYDSFLNSKFNVGAFFFTCFYFFYRKMILYGLGIFIAEILLSIFLGKYYLSILVNVACALLANKIYLDFAKKKTTKIANSTAPDQVVSKCEQKGGTSIGLVFLGLFLTFILGMIVAIIFILTVGVTALTTLFSTMSGLANADSTFNGIETYDSDFVLTEKYEYQIPTGLINESSEDGSNFDYSYGTGLQECSYKMARVSGKINVSEYANNYATYNQTTATEKQINNIKWYEIISTNNTSEEYSYYTEKENKIYVFNYSTMTKSTKCQQLKDQILSTIKEK